MNFTVYNIALIPVIVALVGLAKRLGLNQKFAPVVAIVLGIIAGFVYLAPDDPAKAVLLGLVAGLSSVGLYSGVKNTKEGIQGEE
jgi:L-lactate permease